MLTVASFDIERAHIAFHFEPCDCELYECTFCCCFANPSGIIACFAMMKVRVISQWKTLLCSDNFAYRPIPHANCKQTIIRNRKTNHCFIQCNLSVIRMSQSIILGRNGSIADCYWEALRKIEKRTERCKRERPKMTMIRPYRFVNNNKHGNITRAMNNR